MEKRWKILEADPAVVRLLREQVGIHEALCRILALRGIRNFDEARNFFRPSADMLHDPFRMKDMDRATDRILRAFSARERILVFGDYDVDGTTSVACMLRFLREVYDPSLVECYIPHRQREGYGISRQGIEFARRNGYTLVIALDCGIKSVELISFAAESGIDFIVCDHHLPDEKLPPAAAILNPRQPGCLYPFKELCGCGVGFKLITALYRRLGRPETEAHRFLDLVATATAADIVSMTGENRVLTCLGLKKANADPNPGIRALMDCTGIGAIMDIRSLVFLIAPRINAAGRMDDAIKAVHLFVSDDPEEVRKYAAQLHADNSDRRQADQSITEAALRQLEEDPLSTRRKTTVVYREDWHKGVVGIVASRLIERHYRPTVVLTRSGDLITGSARSVAGFNVYEAVHQCRDLLRGYGGHFYAAGLTLDAAQLEAFRERFEEVVAASIRDELLIPEIEIDAEVGLDALTPTFHHILEQMEPFGPDNGKPVLLVRRLRDSGASRIVKEKHLKLSLRSGSHTFEGIAFGQADKYNLLQSGAVDIVFHLTENQWNGNRSLQMQALDIRSSLTDR